MNNLNYETDNRNIENINRYFELPKDKSGKGYLCCNCDSGTGKNGTGITNYDETHFHCFSCGWKGDKVDWIATKYGLSTSEAIRKGLDLIGKSSVSSSLQGEQTSKIPTAKPQAKPQTDFTEYFKQCQSDIEKTDYWQKRGLSLETCKKYGVGFDVAKQNLIIPTSNYGYFARGTTQNYKQAQGQRHIINSQSLSNMDNFVFVVEGEIDALSLIELGYNAVALGGISNCHEELKQKSKAFLILAFDNDEQGKKAQDKLSKELTAELIPHINADASKLYYRHKDANECLTDDKDFSFTQRLNAVLTDAQTAKTEFEKNPMERINNYSFYREFHKQVQSNRTAELIPTGIERLDKVLIGGLRTGLYVIGAISSLGKTSLCLQIADNLARAKKDVLFVALEMGRNELISKSISRITYIQNGDNSNARNTLDILQGQRVTATGFCKFTDEQQNAIDNATEQYFNEIAPNFWVMEETNKLDVLDIAKQVETMTECRGKAPIVFVDYLQILDPVNEKETDKQNADKIVKTLKHISRDYKTPVFAISSFNRENYNSPVTYASFKESGGIEYGCDVLIGLQLHGMDRDSTETDKDYKERIYNLQAFAKDEHTTELDIDFKILKNRNGLKKDAVITFKKAFNFFS